MLSTNFLESLLKHLNRLEISNIHQVVSNLKDDYALLLKALDIIAIPILIVDHSLKTYYSNRYANDFFLVNQTKEIDDLSEIILYPQLLKMIKDFIKADSTNAVLREELVIEGFNPQIIDLSVYRMDLLNSENRNHYLIMIEDITQKIKNQQEKQLKKNILSMDHLAAGLAHEIKNPLTSIKLYLDLLRRSSLELKQEGDLAQDISHSIGVIQEEVERLNDITTDFLTTIRPLSLNLQRVQSQDIIQYLLDIFKEELLSKKIVFTIKEQENLPALLGDLNYLKVIFFNLMRNAIDSYSQTSTKKTKKILLTLEENAPFIEITIQDNGDGIANHNLDKVFDPYFTTKKDGSGIGLSMVYKIVSEHQGTIQLKSKKGTTFIIMLPIYKGSIRKFLSRRRS